MSRALGPWDLTAVGVNQVIGGAVFLMPSAVAAAVGAWSPVAFVLVGVASLLVALCFAEISSRFDRTGGPYLYTRTAFGPFIGFEVGWMQWFSRVASQGAIANGTVVALGFYLPALADGVGRIIVLTALIGALTAINVRGIRQTAWTVNALTIAKLLPLALFIIVGALAIDPARFAALPSVSWSQAATAALLLTYVFGGYDAVPVLAGEAAQPRKALPFALIMTIAIVTLVMTAIQVVAIGTLPTLASSATPVADAANAFMGSTGALIIGVGSVVSMTGGNHGSILAASRILFAMAEHGDVPRLFGQVHPRYRTPANAIVFTAGVGLVIALSGSFATLAAVAAVARLGSYAGTCAATLALRRDRHRAEVAPALFTVPLGPTIPILAVAISAMVLFGASAAQLLSGVVALAAGALLFATRPRVAAPAPAATRS